MFDNNTNIHKVTRGGQVTLHVIRMYGQVLKTLSLVVVITVLLFNTVWFFSVNTPEQRLFFTQYLDAKARLIFNKESSQDITDENGKKFTVKSTRYINAPIVQKNVSDIYVHSIAGLIISFILGVGVFCTINYYFRKQGSKALKDNIINNHRLAEVKDVNKMLDKRGQKSDLKIGDLHMVKGTETRHIFNVGTTGAGKSNVIKGLIQQIIERGDRFVVFDKSCDLAHDFYHPDSGVILNPFDIRTPSWNIWSDARDDSDLRSIAKSLMPMPSNSENPFWINAARLILTSTAFKMRNDKDKSTIKLLKQLLTTDLDNMQEYLKQTEASTLVSKEIEKTAVSIKTELATYLSSMKYLSDEGKDFSIRDFITGNSKKSGLFITSLADKHHILQPLITMWLDIAINAAMSLSPDLSRRIWIILDEAHSLYELPILSDGANEIRKFGGCLVIGTTSYAGLVKLYGQHGTQAILEQFNTSIYFTTPRAEAAAWASKELGDSEIEEVNENYSYGANTMRDGVNLTKTRVRRPVVTPTDIDRLADYEAYVKLPGSYPIAKVAFDETKTKRMKENGFIRREINEDVFKDLAELEETYIHDPLNAPEYKVKTTTPAKKKPIKKKVFESEKSGEMV